MEEAKEMKKDKRMTGKGEIWNTQRTYKNCERKRQNCLKRYIDI